MADLPPESSSSIKPLEHLDAALRELTEKLIPQYVDEIRDTVPAKLDATLGALVSLALTTKPQGEDLAKLLGQMAIVLHAQQRQAVDLLTRSREEIRSQRRDLTRFQRDYAALNDELQSAEASLADSEQALTDLKRELSDTRIAHDRAELELRTREDEHDTMRSELIKSGRSAQLAADMLSKAAAQKESLRVQVESLTQERDLDHLLIDHLEIRLAEAAKVPSGKIKGGESTPVPEPDPFPQAFAPRQLDFTPLPAASVSPSVSVQQPAASLGHWDYGPTERDFDRLARHITRFEPHQGVAHDTSAYLRDIEFYLQRIPNATAEDKIYLIKLTSSRDVSSFIERQNPSVRADFELLSQSLMEEFSDVTTNVGLTAALTIKQAWSESPQLYYHRLRKAYFGPLNKPGMEEDKNFKDLFVQNLHPTVSHHLGIAACPLTQTSRQLRELAMRAFTKQRLTHAEHQETVALFTVDRSLACEEAFDSSPRDSD